MDAGGGTKMGGVTSVMDDRAGAAVALQRGDFAGAVALLRSHLADHADPEARLELAQLLVLGDELDEPRHHLTLAVQEFTQGGMPRRAAVAASRLGFLYGGFGSPVAARPWFARAWRLLEGQGPCLELGWVAVADVGCNVDDPATLQERADLALDLARRFGDTTLEAKALADGGLALVEQGRVEEGMSRIDEALALVISGATGDPLFTGLTVCSFFSACACVGDLSRMQAWTELLRTARLIGDHGIPVLTSHCSSVYGHLLCTVGQWGEAESVLEGAYAMAEGMTFSKRIHAVTALAELRTLQGRLDEAEELLLGCDHYLEALIPYAKLHLARGDFELAAGVTRRGLRLLGADRVRRVDLLSVLVEASLAQGDLATATTAARELGDIVAVTELPTLAAEGRFAAARVSAAAGDVDAALAELDRALAALGDIDLPLTRAKIHVELARLQAGVDRGAAIAEARAAAAIHARLASPMPPEASTVLSQLGVGDGLRAPGVRRARLCRTGSRWTFCCDTQTFHLRDTKGLWYLAELISHPGVERHVFDLVALTDPADAEGLAVRRALGDAGPVLDGRAKDAYRRRLEQLREQAEDAQALGDDDGAVRLEAEIDALVAELARAMGIGGRDRRLSAGAEKARLNVTRALRAAIARIEQADPDAGGILDRCVRTGTFCSYHPEADGAVSWSAVTGP
jgi:tetratricopeptide (TPR) repeat protein